MSDPYSKLIHEHWDAITGMYALFEHLTPIIEFDVQRKRILAYPSEEYLNELGEREREQAKMRFGQAGASGDLMVFVRDEQQRVLRSYIFPADEAAPDEPQDGHSARRVRR